jgi:hypothetical protein
LIIDTTLKPCDARLLALALAEPEAQLVEQRQARDLVVHRIAIEADVVRGPVLVDVAVGGVVGHIR